MRMHFHWFGHKERTHYILPGDAMTDAAGEGRIHSLQPSVR